MMEIKIEKGKVNVTLSFDLPANNGSVLPQIDLLFNSLHAYIDEQRKFYIDTQESRASLERLKLELDFIEANKKEIIEVDSIAKPI